MHIPEKAAMEHPPCNHNDQASAASISEHYNIFLTKKEELPFFLQRQSVFVPQADSLMPQHCSGDTKPFLLLPLNPYAVSPAGRASFLEDGMSDICG